MDGGQKAGRRYYGEERTARTHPDMLDWDAGLSENAKEKDRMFVRDFQRYWRSRGWRSSGFLVSR
jgi:hypothetical protein